MQDDGLNPYERAIVRNADWFVSRQTQEGYIDAEGDEFYGIRGDATLVGDAATFSPVRAPIWIPPGDPWSG